MLSAAELMQAIEFSQNGQPLTIWNRHQPSDSGPMNAYPTQIYEDFTVHLAGDQTVLINAGDERTDGFRIFNARQRNSIIVFDDPSQPFPSRRRFFEDLIIRPITPGQDVRFRVYRVNRLHTLIAEENQTFTIRKENGNAVEYHGYGWVNCANRGPINAGPCQGGPRGCRGQFTPSGHYWGNLGRICRNQILRPGTYTCVHGSGGPFWTAQNYALRTSWIDAWPDDVRKNCLTETRGFNFFRIIPLANCSLATFTYQNEYPGKLI